MDDAERLDRVQALDVEMHNFDMGVQMTGSDIRANVWRRLGSFLSFLAKGIGAGMSSIATMTFGGRAAPGDLPASQPPKEYRP